MTHTRTNTFTIEESLILECIEEAIGDEVPGKSIVGRCREAEETREDISGLNEELIFTIIGQLIERGFIRRVEEGDGSFLYSRS